jgi:hypothetical protein
VPNAPTGNANAAPTAVTKMSFFIWALLLWITLQESAQFEILRNP